jgi:CRP/FNR family cyclic AMP-dependent transcriptional regulator
VPGVDAASGPPRTFLSSLPDEDREELLRSGHRRRWERAQLLVREGDRADSAIVLVSGLVKIHKRGGGGAEAVLGICGPGDLLGEIAVVRGRARSADASALEEVQGVVVPVPELRALLLRRPGAALALLELALARLQSADARRLEFAAFESLARVTSRLVELAERFGSPGPDGIVDVALPITQEELASWSASSRESTARALRTLRQLGLIETHRRRLLVRDLQRLRAHAPPL